MGLITMFSPPFGRIFFLLFPSIELANPSKIYGIYELQFFLNQLLLSTSTDAHTCHCSTWCILPDDSAHFLRKTSMRWWRLLLTLPKTNQNAPENRPKPNRKVVFQPSIFSENVSFRECTGFFLVSWETKVMHLPCEQSNMAMEIPLFQVMNISYLYI